MSLYKALIRPFLFLLPAERAHRFTLGLLRFTLAFPWNRLLFNLVYGFKHPKLQREVFGITFPNPVGLAAGFDKDAKHIHDLRRMGFGFIEIGTITPRPQDGNPQPRLFRLPKDKGLINRMGFNNEGLEATISRLQDRPKQLILGGNIGKNKVTPNENAVDDYRKCFFALFDHVDYFVVNVSSPNTPGLRALQDKAPLMELLNTLQQLNQQKDTPKPILLKIAPDLTNEQLDDIIDIVRATGIAGLIATNTTISREGLQTDAQQVAAIGNGGLSGAPLNNRSTEVIRYLHERSKGEIPIIGVGGIMSADDALDKLQAGASLVQLYTGFIYEGPGIVKRINKRLVTA